MSEAPVELLFVDDEPQVLSGIKRLLHGLPDRWNSHFAMGADEALAIMAAADIDVVISDINMPGKSGFELLQEIRQADWGEDLPVLIVTGDSEYSLKRQALDLGATDLLLKPVSRENLVSRIRNMVRLKSYQDTIKQHNQILDAKVKERTRELEESRLDLIWRLAKTAECRDSNTGNHILRVAHFCRILAENLGLEQKNIERIFQTSPLHDIGKIGIPDSVLLKPGKLTGQERQVIQGHCQLGAELLKQDIFPGSPLREYRDGAEELLSQQNHNPFLTMAADIALCHHEFWNGEGYPAGLSGDAIPLAARICAVADVYDALSSSRPYKGALPEAEVLAIMREGNGRQFDPRVFACFEQSLPQLRQIQQDLVDRRD
ncbi:MAG: response regulator [Thermodesulfobacteriota bacterium]|nr:response regulator [Thermodesulfobacteriota bacterium]